MKGNSSEIRFRLDYATSRSSMQRRSLNPLTNYYPQNHRQDRNISWQKLETHAYNYGHSRYVRKNYLQYKIGYCKRNPEIYTVPPKSEVAGIYLLTR